MFQWGVGCLSLQRLRASSQSVVVGSEACSEMHPKKCVGDCAFVGALSYISSPSHWFQVVIMVTVGNITKGTSAYEV